MKKAFINDRLYTMLLIMGKLQPFVEELEGQILFGMLLGEVKKLEKGAK